MTDIKLEFTEEMLRRIYQGKKICTTRESIHGSRGDTFEDPRGNKYRILEIIPTKLKKAIETYYSLEGFSDPQEFFDYWLKFKEIDTSKQYKFTKEYSQKPAYIHFFQLIVE